jgi:AcrR family transcriptional regulator
VVSSAGAERLDGASSPPDDANGERQHTEHGLERKQQLLDAAAELFADRGYSATRIADICRTAGVAKGLFYWYFPTKGALFAELVRTMRLRLRRAQRVAMDPAADAVTRIADGAEASVRFMADHAAYFALLDVERTDPEVADVLAEGAGVYLDDVRRLVEDGAPGRSPMHRRSSSRSGCSGPCRRSRTRTAMAASATTSPSTSSRRSSAGGSSTRFASAARLRCRGRAMLPCSSGP